MRDNMTGDNLDEQMAKWFPFIATLFIFILVSNLIGYIPLPVNTETSSRCSALHIPSFSALRRHRNCRSRWCSRWGCSSPTPSKASAHKGPIGYLKSLDPGGVTGADGCLIFSLEILSNFLRLISLTIRLLANMLAGHLLILFMAGALGGAPRPAAAGLVHAAVRHRCSSCSRRPDRRPAGLHLRHPDRHLSRRRGRATDH